MEKNFGFHFEGVGNGLIAYDLWNLIINNINLLYQFFTTCKGVTNCNPLFSECYQQALRV